jgi:hypothetical protein
MIDRDIQLTKIVKAKFEMGIWVIAVIDENNFFYDVRFQGTGEETDSELLENTYNVLLGIDKKTLITLPVDITRETIIGITPNIKD